MINPPVHPFIFAAARDYDDRSILTRRGARVVERVCLENRSTRKGTGGSNPSLSADRPPRSGGVQVEGRDQACLVKRHSACTRGPRSGSPIDASPKKGKRVSRNPSLSANAARAAGDDAAPEDAELAPGSFRGCGIKDRKAAAALKPPPKGTRVSRNPSLSDDRSLPREVEKRVSHNSYLSIYQINPKCFSS